MSMSDPFTAAALTVGGAVVGALAMVGVAFLNRGPAIQLAINGAAKALLEEYRERAVADSKRIERLDARIEHLEREIHGLRSWIELRGMDPPQRRESRETGVPD